MIRNSFKFKCKKHFELFSVSDFTKSFNFMLETKRYNTFSCIVLLVFPNLLLDENEIN